MSNVPLQQIGKDTFIMTGRSYPSIRLIDPTAVVAILARTLGGNDGCVILLLGGHKMEVGDVNPEEAGRIINAMRNRERTGRDEG